MVILALVLGLCLISALVGLIVGKAIRGPLPPQPRVRTRIYDPHHLTGAGAWADAGYQPVADYVQGGPYDGDDAA